MGAPPTEPARGGVATAPVKLVYVMGAGRSGSTILGVTLGNCEGFFYAGELDKWLPRRGVPRVGGEEGERFWERVLAGVDGAEELFGNEVRAMERSSSLFSLRKLRLRRRLRARYRLISGELCRAVAHESGAAHVLDTSHYPLRARELRAIPGIELHLIFLVRDPHGIVASMSREDVPERSFGTLTANAYMWLTYTLSLAMFLTHPRARRTFLRHETLTSEPKDTLRWLLAHLGSDAPLPDLDALAVGCPIQGNRLIRAGTVSLGRGSGRASRRRALTSVMQLPWRAVFAVLGPSPGRSEA